MEIANERLRIFLDAAASEDTGPLGELEKEALEERVPIIRTDTRRLLRVLLAMKRPERILEVGTGTGFSALYMEACAPEVQEIVTIEQFPQRIEKAEAHFAQYDTEKKIRLRKGDAAALLPELPAETFDFLFLDAAKGQYGSFLPELLRVLLPGGVLVADNVLQDGTVLESRFAVTRRDRTIHARMRDFLREILQDEALTTTVLPVGDGVSVSVRK